MRDKFTRSELEMVYQYAAPTKEETLAGLKEIVPVIQDAQTKAVVQSTINRWNRYRSRSAANLSLIQKRIFWKNGQEQRELKDRAAALQAELDKSQAATVNAEKLWVSSESTLPLRN